MDFRFVFLRTSPGATVDSFPFGHIHHRELYGPACCLYPDSRDRRIALLVATTDDCADFSGRCMAENGYKENLDPLAVELDIKLHSSII